jgi:hypothetical protein|tara:strand:+ start:6324 stop:7049 length:726 start_codon:yes stop_codon:yes gene_type:complete
VKKDKITFILTSCGRLDLLERTLDSFFKFNTAEIERYIITEDSADPEVFKACETLNKEKYDSKLEFIFNHKKLGQSRSIDAAYATIDTEYIFHLEDDYEFYRSGFIEISKDLLESRPEILQGWLQSKKDGQVNVICPKVFKTNKGTSFRYVMPVSFYTGRIIEGKKEVVINYYGFTYRPTLKRLKDYLELGNGGYTQYGLEHLVDYAYRDMGYRIVSLTERDDDGYVNHTGWDDRVKDHVH